MLRTFITTLPFLALPALSMAEINYTVTPVEVTDWKAVFGKVEPRDSVPARARLGGTMTEILVSEGDLVQEGQKIGLISDEKLALRLIAVDATLASLTAQLENAEVELKRGESLVERGVATAQRLDALRTQVDVVKGQIAATEAERQVIEQQAAEGAVLAPIAGRVLTVPVTKGAVLMPGEVIAMVGGGGVFLRLAVPERHAAVLTEGVEILIGADGQEQVGRLAKLYPQIENGRVIADVEVPELNASFVDARVLVRLPVASSSKLVVPSEAVATRMGLDFVTVKTGDHLIERTIVAGETVVLDGVNMIEILTGLVPGDVVVDPIQPKAGGGHE
ncbi:efflux RND transporter periplasmic adaptor subunit [Aliiroseovarius sp. KMU-50]|uniref:Efflux RND transporter periplasmic adaptor subunit n=1 Tax=Aliiroseovarius salicola TaxID=3009082 RepID=A0ABT4W609_9RHOB|nr:efflux RND transporter periplasmic adaptor subunit [Aliiroseovarius sp. KMU-50]MDA5095267.1 efflux RND transporter periplasmic adaptor subunit [Aliiroseovarius sp. KMU-50]